MKTTQTTVLITGGSAGIGLEIAKVFDQKGNHVIITGRDENRLQKAAAQLHNATPIQCDVTNEAEVNQLVERLYTDFPELNIVINNAGKAFYYSLVGQENGYEKAGEEMLTNYLSVIRLTEKLVPLLNTQPEAALVNVSSIVAFAPNHRLATYGASKAALHSYTQSLRISLERSSNTKVFELMPPLVNTDFSQEIGGQNGIAPSVVAIDLLNALENNEYEIHVGRTAQLYKLALSSPAEALAAMNA